MPDSLASAQFPGRVAHICTQAELNALLSPASPSQSTSNFDDTTAFRLPAPRSGPKQEFISGSKKDFETLGRNFKSTFVGLAGHVRILGDLYKRTNRTHGDVALNTLRIVVEGDNVAPYVLDIPEYPWISHQRYFQNEELGSGA